MGIGFGAFKPYNTRCVCIVTPLWCIAPLLPGHAWSGVCCDITGHARKQQGHSCYDFESTRPSFPWRFFVYTIRGARMKIGTQIEQIRISENIPVYAMCDILSITTELEYHKIVTGRIHLTTYQKIMFVINTCHGLDI